MEALGTALNVSSIEQTQFFRVFKFSNKFPHKISSSMQNATQVYKTVQNEATAIGLLRYRI
jgi:hypothetical protein